MASDSRVIDLEERETRIFPRGDLFDAQGRSRILKECRDLSAIELGEAVDGVRLRALGLIGFLPLTDTIVLNLRPKFSIGNLWHMLSLADEEFATILTVSRAYEASAFSAPHLLLARSFVHYVRHLLSSGIARGYEVKSHAGHYSPKLHFGNTVSRYLCRGDEVNVSSSVFNFTASSEANGVLKAGCLAFLRLLPRSPSWHADRRLLIEALDTLALVSPRVIQFDDLHMADALPMWLRTAYRGAFTAYSLLAGFKKIGFPFNAGGNTMPSFLFSLDNVFESFVRNVLRIGLVPEVSVLNGDLPRHQTSLFADNRRFPAKPDLIFQRAGRAVALGEVKYKPRLKEADRYQLISHAAAYRVKVAIWISPSGPGTQQELEYVGALSNGTKFYHYKIDLRADLLSAGASMTAEIEDLLSSVA